MIQVIYPIPEKLPLNYARFIQIFNTCESLAKLGIRINIYCALKRDYKIQDMLNYYDISGSENLNIRKLPYFSLKGPLNLKLTWNFIYKISLFLNLFFREKFLNLSKIVLFLRYPDLTYFLLKFKKKLNFLLIYEAHELYFLKNKKYFKIEKEIFKNSDLIICITQNLKNQIIKIFNSDRRKIHVIPDAVKDKWLEIKKEKGEYIFYAGNFKKWKGVEVLIEAMKYLPNEKLLLAGEGKELKNLMNKVKKLNLENQVKFLGYIPHGKVLFYLAKSKFGILPNIEEETSNFTSPLKLFEYMALGLPIIASNIPVFREILTHGENAWFFESGNPQALAEAIKFLSENSQIAKSLALKAKEQAKNYTFTKRAEKIKKLIEENLK